MVPKKEPPLVRAEMICCIVAALITAGCLIHHPDSDLPVGCNPYFNDRSQCTAICARPQGSVKQNITA